MSRMIKVFRTSLLKGILCLGLPLFFFSCTDDNSTTHGVWYGRADLDGPARGEAAYFTIGEQGYVCGGFKGRPKEDNYIKDLWRYDMSASNGAWTQCASMPDEAPGRSRAIGFAVGNYGYVATGVNAFLDKYYNDTWQYNPATDTWLEMDEFPRGDDNNYGRYYGIGFGIGNYGYAGTGRNTDGELKDLYRLDPTQPRGSQWTALENPFPGKKRAGSSVFVINDVAYICVGSANGSLLDDFYKFDPSKTGEDQWTELRHTSNYETKQTYDDKYEAIKRAGAVAFVINGKGYLVTGSTGLETGGSMKTDYWEYNPATDLWNNEDFTPITKSRTNISGRVFAVAFSTGTRGFFGTGSAGSSNTTRLDDLIELSPYEEYEE